jgi:hypothetical protein
MVIGKDFAWAHMPKTGGNATHTLFSLFPQLVTKVDDIDRHDKHKSFADCQQAVQGKELILNIRRLPSWILSVAQHFSRHGAYPDYKPLPMWSKEQMIEHRRADEMIEQFTAKGRLKVRRWFRMENLNADFLDYVSLKTEVPESQRAGILNFRKMNANEYDHDLGQWFAADDIRRLYRNNPRWAAVERKAYGNLVVETSTIYRMAGWIKRKSASLRKAA